MHLFITIDIKNIGANRTFIKLVLNFVHYQKIKNKKTPTVRSEFRPKQLEQHIFFSGLSICDEG